MDIQVRVPPGLAAVHNLIVLLDPCDLEDIVEEMAQLQGPSDPHQGTPPESSGTLASGPISRQEELRAAQ